MIVGFSGCILHPFYLENLYVKILKKGFYMNLKTMTILECSRVFSLPMTVFSWLVVFVYGVVNSGNVIYGIVAFIGLSFAHLATNLLDDYIDYKFLIKQVNFDKEQYLIQTQKTKCRYIINGTVSEKQILTIVLVYLVLAFLSGLFLFFKCIFFYIMFI